jgi:hypothetical protein
MSNSDPSASESQVVVVPPMDPKKAAKPGVGEALELKDKEITARIISKWLDELFRIPGTDFKIGLDPIIDFVPGIGDFLSSSVSLVVIIEAVRTRVSPSVVLRMVGNMCTNALIGAVPGIGPVFSAFFKSNKRNLGLLTKWHEGNQHEIQTKSRWFVLAWVGLIFLALSAVLLIWGFYIWGLWQVGQKVAGVFS